MRFLKSSILFLLFLGCPAGCHASAIEGKITAQQAKDNIGRTVTVCGKVASANYATRSRKQPTFLNLDEPFPRHIFTTVIWGNDRAKFGQPEVELLNKRICVTGLIEEYKGKPEMILRDRDQLKQQ